MGRERGSYGVSDERREVLTSRASSMGYATNPKFTLDMGLYVW
jgi:hypothetical protein